MRTALFLLFLLALAAVPGSLLPQRGINPIGVSDYRARTPARPVVRPVRLFDVFAAPWFAAIYLLLFVSLIGCVVPAAATTCGPAGASRRPRRATSGACRCPDGSSRRGTRGRARARRAVAAVSRFRVDSGDGWVAAEKGFLRETGNLFFHLAIVVLLLGVGLGSFGGFKGDALVVEGEGFADTLTQYDRLTPGGAFDVGTLPPFSLTLQDFSATYETGRTSRVRRAPSRPRSRCVTLRAPRRTR